MFKIGRYKVPYTYEYYAISVQDLMAPERSLYNVNYSLNRQYGFMGWGQLMKKRLDYAVGIFNGGRRSFEDTNSEKDVMAYMNFRPFGNSEELPFLQNLNLSASTDFGNQNNPLTPQALKTAANPSNNPGALLASPSFLTFNNNIMEIGNRDLWDLNIAYYYKGLSLLGAWDWGFTDYALANTRNKTRLPVTGYYVQAAYFLTGEEILRRSQVKPLHPFDLRKGKFGTGAFEVHSRFSEIHLGQQVFTHGLADPNLWTNQAYAIDTGLNWYLNLYVKVFFDWQHAVFGSPVASGPGQFQKTSDLFWLRCQIYF
jgi:phosphate-selective porin OprO/OprP